MKIECQVIHETDFNDTRRQIFAKMLSQQGKVQGNSTDKVDRCKLICIAKENDKPTAIGAIKQKHHLTLLNRKLGYPNSLMSLNGN